jgi:hypothetical protein
MALAAVTMALSGCLGGGGGGGGAGDPIDYMNTTNETSAQALEGFTLLQDRFAALNGAAATLAPTAPSALPTTGAARYDGVMRIANQNAAIHGDMALDVGFATSRVTGQVTNLRTEYIPIEGDLTIGPAELNRAATGSEPAFRAPVLGRNLNFDTVYQDIDGQIRGDFADRGQTVILTGSARMTLSETEDAHTAPADWGIRAIGTR